MLISAISLICSVSLLILLAAKRIDGVHIALAHMSITAIVAIGFASAYIQANSSQRASGASRSAIAATTARFSGYVFGWAAVCLLATYATGIEVWREWLHFTGGCVALAGLCLVFGIMLQKDADAGREDATLLKLSQALAVMMLVAMVATILGLLIDGKMARFLNPRFSDWAANNFFFFGAIALAAISGYALKFKSE